MRLNHVRSKLLAFAFLALMSFVLEGCSGSNSSSQQPLSLDKSVDDVVQNSMRSTAVPGVTVALAQNGTVIYAQGYGFSDLMTQQAMQPNVIFEIGSITKQFTAAIIMKLQEQALLHVDDSMTIYLPEYGFPSAITIRMLLTHTSGLANFTTFPQFTGWSATGVSEATVLTAISQFPPNFPPGTQYQYSNSNYFALGSIIEKVTGQSYAANLDQYIYQPLGLQSTYYMLPPTDLSATGYSGTGILPVTPWDRSVAFAAGALSTNVYDLVTWENGLMNGKAVSPASFKAMTTSNGFVSQGFYPGGFSYGFGLALSTVNGHPVMWHNGGVAGFTTEEIVFLDSSFTLVVFTNYDGADPHTLVVAILNAVCSPQLLSSSCG